jgi:replicative DNA helicase
MNTIELEEAIIGALMVEKTSIDRIGSLTPQMFISTPHKLIFEAIQELTSNNIAIDLLTINTKLKQKGQLELIGGISELAKITSRVSSSAHIEHHCAIIYQEYVKREMIRIFSQKLQILASDGADGFQEKENIIAELESLTIRAKKDFNNFQSIAVDNLQKLEKLQQSGLTITGIDTKFRKLNKLGSGWQNTDLIIIGARPATGKTAFALNIAENIARQNIPVAIFSMEMSSSQLVDRIISKVSRVPAFKIKSAMLSQGDWIDIHAQNFNLPIYIDDTPSLNIQEFKIKSRRAKKDFNIGFIIVDYLQLMTTFTKGNRDQQLGEISRNLKAIAKELNVPVIALAQLNRDVEKSNRLPMLSDLRESGSIEQDADMVCFLHDNGEPTDIVGDVGLVIAKHRAGSLGIIPFEFEKETQTFKEKENGY